MLDKTQKSVSIIYYIVAIIGIIWGLNNCSDKSADVGNKVEVTSNISTQTLPNKSDNKLQQTEAEVPAQSTQSSPKSMNKFAYIYNSCYGSWSNYLKSALCGIVVLFLLSIPSFFDKTTDKDDIKFGISMILIFGVIFGPLLTAIFGSIFYYLQILMTYVYM